MVVGSVLRSNQSFFSIKDDSGMFRARGTMMQIKWRISILPSKCGKFLLVDGWSALEH